MKRAEQHLNVLQRDYGVSNNLTAYRLRPEMHREGLEYRFYLIDSVPEIDEAVPFIVGEFFFNLRAALDHLSYQLHVRHYRGRMPPDAERHASFPILDANEISKRGTDDPRKWNEIKRLGKRERTAIQQFQPYITCNDDLKLTREVLDVLAFLNNIDKHRRLHIIRSLPAAVSKAEQFPARCGFRQTIFFRPLVAGTEVERWTFEEPPTEMSVEHSCWPQVVLDEPSRGIRVYLPEFLFQALGQASRVVERFNTRFGYKPWRTWQALG